MTAIRLRPETVTQGVMLAAVGGFLDAFTFVRYAVFANAQSGNVVLFGVDAASSQWRDALLRLAPIAAFAVGVIVVETLSRPGTRRLVRRPLRLALGAEIVGLLMVAALPDRAPQLVVTVTVSFVASIQFSTFRTLVDTPYSTLLTSGNLRNLVVGVHHWLTDRDVSARTQAIRFALVVGAFALGAVVGALITSHVGNRAVAVPAGLLLVVLVALVVETRRIERATDGDPSAATS